MTRWVVGGGRTCVNRVRGVVGRDVPVEAQATGVGFGRVSPTTFLVISEGRTTRLTRFTNVWSGSFCFRHTEGSKERSLPLTPYRHRSAQDNHRVRCRVGEIVP